MYRRMRRKPSQHVVPHIGGWAVKAEGAERASRVFENKFAAVDYAHKLAAKQMTHVVIHNEDGTFRRSDAFQQLSELVHAPILSSADREDGAQA
jgi:hypothetical protein